MGDAGLTGWETGTRLLCEASEPSASPGNAQNTLAQPTVWLTIALTTVVCILPVVAFRFLKLNLRPGLSDTVSRRVCPSVLVRPGRPVLGLRAPSRCWCVTLPP